MIESISQKPAEIVLSPVKMAKLRVLYVDDDSSSLNVTKQCLEMEGPFQVGTACSVEEALAKLEKEQYDAVVSDYQMPRKNGLVFLKELRQRGNGVPFIMFTGKGREEVAVKAWNLGADHYVNKNGDPETVYCELAHLLQACVEKHDAEARARETIQNLQTIYQNALEGIGYVDREENIIYANKVFADIVGYEPEQLVGVNLRELVDDENWARILSETKRRQHGQSGRYEIEFRRRNGTTRDAFVSSSPLLDHNGQFAGTICIVLDITERKKAEHESFDRQMMLQSVFDASPNALLIVGLNGKILDCNKRAQEIFGYSSKSELVGRIAIEYIAEEDLQRAMENMEKTLKQGLMKNIEYTIITKDNRKCTLLVSASVLRDACRNPLGFVSAIENITERKQGEQELRCFSLAIKTSLDGVISGDLNGNITDVNEAALRMYGGTEKSDLIGKNVIDLLIERDRTRALHDSMESMRTGQGKTVEYCALTKSGTEVPIEITTAFIKEEQGEPTGFVDIIRNIAERKKAELALRESEARYRLLVEQSLAGIIIAQGPAVHAVFVNRATTDIWGYTAEEFYSLSQQQIEKMIHPEDRSLFFKSFEDRLEGKNVPSHYEFRALRKDGNVIWLEISAGLIEYNGRPAVQGIFTDITERRKAEKAIRESQQKFEALFRGNPEAAVYLDLDFRILDVNPRFCQLFGYSAEEVMGKKLIEVIVPESLLEEAEGLDRDAQKGYVRHETMRKRKDGSLVPVSISAGTVTLEDNLLGYVGTYKDITDLKKLEEKLRVVGGLTRHDARNKLAVVTGNAYLLRRKLAGNPEAIEHLTDMENAVKNVEAIFEFARIYETLGVEGLANVNIGKAVDEAASLFSDLKGIKITNGCHGLTVLADSLLRQLVYNLIDNSLKYGKKISQIRIRYEKAEGNQLRLVYEDDGVGIALDAKPKIFDEGYTTGKGSGYGLYLVKRMMEAYGWTIQETGTPGNGVRFTIAIPEKNQDGKENYQLPTNRHV